MLARVARPGDPASLAGGTRPVRLRASAGGFEERAQPNRGGPSGPRGATVRLRPFFEAPRAREDRRSAPREDALGSLALRQVFVRGRARSRLILLERTLGRYSRSRERQ